MRLGSGVHEVFTKNVMFYTVICHIFRKNSSNSIVAKIGLSLHMSQVAQQGLPPVLNIKLHTWVEKGTA